MRRRPFLAVLICVLVIGLGTAASRDQLDGTLTGTITDEHGTSVANARILATDSSGVQAETQTDADGRYELHVPNGTVWLEIQAACCTRQIREVKVATGKLTSLDVAIWPQTYTPDGPARLVYGRTFDPRTNGGQPWVRVGLRVGADYYETASRENGIYFLEVPEASLNGLASRVDLRETRFNVTLDSDTRLDIPVHWGSATFAVRVVPSGSASALRVGPCPKPECSAGPVTSEDGRFAFGEVDGSNRFALESGFSYARGKIVSGMYELRATGDGGSATAKATLEVLPGQSWDLEARPRPASDDRLRLAGTVRDATSGEPLEGVWVDVRNEPRGQSSPTMQTDANGRFEALVSPGAVTVLVQPYDNATRARYGRTYYPAHETLALAQAQDLDVLVPRTRLWPQASPVTLVGWVVDSSTTRGVAGATLHLRNEATYEWGQATADSDGSYRFTVQSGRYTLAAIGKDRPWSLTSFDAVEEATWQNLTLIDPACCGVQETGGWYGHLVQPSYYVPGVTPVSPTPSPTPTNEPAPSSASPTLPPLSQAQGPASQGSPITGHGMAIIAGSAGGLGPYQSIGNVVAPDPKQPEGNGVGRPVPAAEAYLGIVSAAAIVVASRRERNRHR